MFTLIAAVFHKIGLVGVALLMLVENLVPVIPSELILPMAGSRRRGDRSARCS
jgi:membrane protein DedA with SNARE-associated domain